MKSDVNSVLIYIGILLIEMLFAQCAQFFWRKRRGSYKLFLLLTFLVISLFSGFRHYTVGLDLNTYMNGSIKHISQGYFSVVNQPVGFKFIVLVLCKIFGTTQAVVVFFSLATNTLILWRLWDYRKKISYSFSVFIYYTFFFASTLNVFRQSLTIAIIFFSTRLLDEKKYVRYCLVVLGCILIHSSSIVGFLLLILDIWIKSQKDINNKYRRKLKRIMVYGSPIILTIAGMLILNFFDYQHYIELMRSRVRVSMGFMYPIQVFFCWLSWKSIKRQYKFYETETFNEIRYIYCCCMIGFLGTCLIIFVNEIQRVFWIFIMYQFIYQSMVLANKKMMYRYRTIYFFLGVHTFIAEMFSSGNGIMPYLTYWMR